MRSCARTSRRSHGAPRDALRDTEFASLRAELASYKDAEQRASLLEETVASQAEEIRRLSEAAGGRRVRGAGAAPADAAGLFGAPPPADDGVVDELKKRIAELEASDASEALAARVAEAAQLQRESPGPGRREHKCIKCIGGGQRTPPDGARRAQGQRGDSTVRNPRNQSWTSLEGSAGSCGNKRRTFRGR